MLYRALYGESGLWVRPHAMFFGEAEVDGLREPPLRVRRRSAARKDARRERAAVVRDTPGLVEPDAIFQRMVHAARGSDTHARRLNSHSDESTAARRAAPDQAVGIGMGMGMGSGRTSA